METKRTPCGGAPASPGPACAAVAVVEQESRRAAATNAALLTIRERPELGPPREPRHAEEARRSWRARCQGWGAGGRLGISYIDGSPARESGPGNGFMDGEGDTMELPALDPRERQRIGHSGRCGLCLAAGSRAVKGPSLPHPPRSLGTGALMGEGGSRCGPLSGWAGRGAVGTPPSLVSGPAQFLRSRTATVAHVRGAPLSSG